MALNVTVTGFEIWFAIGVKYLDLKRRLQYWISRYSIWDLPITVFHGHRIFITLFVNWNHVKYVFIMFLILWKRFWIWRVYLQWENQTMERYCCDKALLLTKWYILGSDWLGAWQLDLRGMFRSLPSRACSLFVERKYIYGTVCLMAVNINKIMWP